MTPFTEEFIADRRAMLRDDPDAARQMWEGKFKVDENRGSGRTSARLMTLLPGDIYIVGHSREIEYVWHLLHHLRPEFEARKENIWSLDRLRRDQLAGRRCAVVLDHAATPNERDLALLVEYWDSHRALPSA